MTWLQLLVLGAGGYFAYTIFIQKKPFIPPLSHKMQARRPLMHARRPLMRPRRLLTRPIGKLHHGILAKPPQPVIPKNLKPAKEEIKPKEHKLEKPKTTIHRHRKPIKKKDIFSRLSDITKTQREEKLEKSIKSLKMTDAELNERISKLKRELKVPIKK